MSAVLQHCGANAAEAPDGAVPISYFTSKESIEPKSALDMVYFGVHEKAQAVCGGHGGVSLFHRHAVRHCQWRQR